MRTQTVQVKLCIDEPEETGGLQLQEVHLEPHAEPLPKTLKIPSSRKKPSSQKIPSTLQEA